MRYQVTVQPSGRQFTAEADETLLDAALRQGLTMPYGCKDGACGPARVTSNRAPLTTATRRHTP
jgi:Ferredoxin